MCLCCAEKTGIISRMKKFLFLISAVVTVVSYGGSLVECERFADKGGWAVDSQFIDEMGSSYLLAHGLGKPVADAVTRIDVKKKRTVRCIRPHQELDSSLELASGRNVFACR